MKTIIHKSRVALLCALCFSAFAARSQSSSTSRIGLYHWKEEVFMTPCNVAGDSVGLPITSQEGQKFRVLQVNGTKATIKVLDYISPGGKSVKPEFFKYNYLGDSTELKTLPEANLKSQNYGDNQAYFSVETILLDACADKENMIGGSLAAGVINFPFKYRPQKNNSDFSGAFNFGAGIGYTFPHKSYRKFVYSVLSGYSISNVVLDSSNTNRNQGQLASTNNFTALSLSLGGMVQYGKVQAGIFVGWDRLSKINQRQFDWQYNSKPWISIGFGLAIFSEQNEQSSKSPATRQ